MKSTDEIKIAINSISELLKITDNRGDGLLSGNTGKCLFYAELYMQTNNDDYFELLEETLTKIIDGFKGKDLLYTFSDGLCGLIWLLHNITKKCFCTYDHYSESWRPDVSILNGLSGIGLVFIDLLRDNCNKRKKLPKTKIGVDFLINRQKRRAENSPQNALILLIFGVFHSSKIPQNFFVEKMFLEANFV
jgi:hypothetical protein